MVHPKKEKKEKPKEQKQKKKRKNVTSLGRRKIEIKRIEKDSNRQVTLSKRRKGLFNKAAELCILTGAEIGIITRAENGKMSTFCHPNLDGVIHGYLNGTSSDPAAFPPAQIDADLVEENKRLSAELKAEKKLKAENVGNDNYWWNEPMDNLGLEELEQCLDCLIDLRNNVMALSSSSSSEEGAPAEEKAAVFNDQYHHSQFMGVSDNVGVEQTTRADELVSSSEYFDLEKSMLAEELMKDSPFSSGQEYQSSDYFLYTRGCNFPFLLEN